MKYTELKPRLHLSLLKKQFVEKIKLKLFLKRIKKQRRLCVALGKRELKTAWQIVWHY